MTQSEFADIIRIKQAMVSRYEADKETPSPRILLRMARFSGHSIEWLLTGTESLGGAGEPMDVRRVGAKTDEELTTDDYLYLAGDYLRDTKDPQIDGFIELMKDAFKDPEHMKQLIDFWRYLRFKDVSGSGE